MSDYLTSKQVEQLLKPINSRRVGKDGNERDVWRLVDRRGNDECWPWLGYVSDHGYGKWSPVVGRCVRAHRFIYEMLVGPIPHGHDLDHICHAPPCEGGRTCQHRRCVNPSHLTPATRAQNLYRVAWPNASKTHCPSGHLYSGANLYINSKGRRECRVCRRAAVRRCKAKAVAS